MNRTAPSGATTDLWHRRMIRVDAVGEVAKDREPDDEREKRHLYPRARNKKRASWPALHVLGRMHFLNPIPGLPNEPRMFLAH